MNKGKLQIDMVTQFYEKMNRDNNCNELIIFPENELLLCEVEQKCIEIIEEINKGAIIYVQTGDVLFLKCMLVYAENNNIKVETLLNGEIKDNDQELFKAHYNFFQRMEKLASI